MNPAPTGFRADAGLRAICGIMAANVRQKSESTAPGGLKGCKICVLSGKMRNFAPFFKKTMPYGST
jgi:hypothetical protein